MARNSLADNSPEGARRLGALTERPKTVRGSLGVSSDGTLDIDDFYSFRLGRRSRIDIRLSGLQSDASLRILRGNDVIATSNRRGTRNERIRRNLNPGVFFIRVSQDNRDTRYVLRASAGEPTNGGGGGGRWRWAAVAAAAERLISRICLLPIVIQVIFLQPPLTIRDNLVFVRSPMRLEARTTMVIGIQPISIASQWRVVIESPSQQVMCLAAL
ncbi:MAG: hypothetical protein HC827_16170 [Cyanobacteria bacterium RM1_2_2]|nr:hypothetical protein [Cyanobacteria bacterium RM1_2_2]